MDDNAIAALCLIGHIVVVMVMSSRSDHGLAAGEKTPMCWRAAKYVNA